MNTSPPLSLDALLRQAAERIENAAAGSLLAHVLGKPVGWLFAHGDEIIDTPTRGRFEALVDACLAGEPVAYLTGSRGFWTLELEVTPDTLIPRPETELLVELVLARVPVSSSARIADLGTGSGAIALAVASERPHADVLATDTSSAALAVARRNAQANAIGNVRFVQGSWLLPLSGERFDLIASNPPYIAEGDPHLRWLQHEPVNALTSGADGLDAIREIVAAARDHLEPEGWLLLEHGWDQGDAVRALMQAADYAEVSTARDLENRDRVTLGRVR